MATTSEKTFLPKNGNLKGSIISSIEDYKKEYKDSIDNNSDFWGRKAKEMLSWQHEFQQINDCDFNE